MSYVHGKFGMTSAPRVMLRFPQHPCMNQQVPVIECLSASVRHNKASTARNDYWCDLPRVAEDIQAVDVAMPHVITHRLRNTHMLATLCRRNETMQGDIDYCLITLQVPGGGCLDSFQG